MINDNWKQVLNQTTNNAEFAEVRAKVERFTDDISTYIVGDGNKQGVCNRMVAVMTVLSQWESMNAMIISSNVDFAIKRMKETNK